MSTVTDALNRKKRWDESHRFFILNGTPGDKIMMSKIPALAYKGGEVFADFLFVSQNTFLSFSKIYISCCNNVSTGIENILNNDRSNPCL